MPETSLGGDDREFPPTRWTLILSSRGDAARQRAALEDMLAAYWKPLYVCARRKGLSIEDAKDAIQDVFARLFEREFLDRLDPAKGRFRGYLRAALDHRLVNLHEERSALKRGGGARTVSLDFDVAERDVGAAPENADAAFDREWALAVMERSLARLRGEFAAGERKGPIDAVLAFFRPDGAPPSYEQAARDVDMTPVQFKAFLHRARVRFREIVRDEVADTVADGGEIDAEVADLIRILRS